MKNTLLLTLAILVGCSSPSSNEEDNTTDSLNTSTEDMSVEQNDPEISINPISHATFVMQYGDLTVYNDPNGGAGAFAEYPSPDIVLISDIHGDHLNQATLDSLDLSSAVIVAPQAVADQLPARYQSMLKIMGNGEEAAVKNIQIRAIPMYNLPESDDSRHVKGRGNGYVLTVGDTNIYIAGDTEDIEEMRALENIDMAFVPMNMPYTMPVEQAAEGVIAFAPGVVYPYHYRGQGGLSDVEKFKQLVEASGKDIEVRLLDWYSMNN